MKKLSFTRAISVALGMGCFPLAALSQQRTPPTLPPAVSVDIRPVLEAWVATLDLPSVASQKRVELVSLEQGAAKPMLLNRPAQWPRTNAAEPVKLAGYRVPFTAVVRNVAKMGGDPILLSRYVAAKRDTLTPFIVESLSTDSAMVRRYGAPQLIAPNRTFTVSGFFYCYASTSPTVVFSYPYYPSAAGKVTLPVKPLR